MAEGVGFEPTDACTSTVFKTVAFDRSATPPPFFKYLDQVASATALIRIFRIFENPHPYRAYSLTFGSLRRPNSYFKKFIDR